MPNVPQLEVEMTQPTLTLFPASDYVRFEQVPFGRKSIDLVCLNRSGPHTTTVELKIRNWRQALWQASVNMQIANESYIAIWAGFVHRAEKHCDLLTAYGVGLIAVSASSAEILLPSRDPVQRIARSKKCEWYECLLRTA
jgi:hypothetical protein